MRIRQKAAMVMASAAALLGASLVSGAPANAVPPVPEAADCTGRYGDLKAYHKTNQETNMRKYFLSDSPLIATFAKGTTLHIYYRQMDNGYGVEWLDVGYSDRSVDYCGWVLNSHIDWNS